MKYRYTRHAIQRMAERGVSVETVESIIQSGTIITRYEDDKPFPSYLVLGFVASVPWHVVYSKEETITGIVAHVITIYPPDPLEWDGFFSKRKTQNELHYL